MDLFCSRPFTQLEVASEGSVRICCNDWLPQPIGNLKEQNIDQAWTSEMAQKIRSSALDGTLKYCDHSHCPMIQSQTGSVKKLSSLTKQELKKWRQQLERPSTTSVSRLIVAHDKLCNLSCPSCRHEFYRADQKEREFIESVYDQLPPLLPNLKEMKLLGSGDPFASKYCLRFLNQLSKGNYPNLQLQLHTNGLLLNEERWALIEKSKIKIHRLEISIDAATPETYKINRQGGDFNQLLDRLEFVHSLKKEKKIDWVTFSFVVQKNNFREMPDFIDLAQHFNANESYFSKLNNWDVFSDDEYRERAVHQTGHPEHHEFLKVLKSVAHVKGFYSNLTGLIKEDSMKLSQDH